MKLFPSRIAFLIAITVLAPHASAQTLYWAGGYNSDNTGSGASISFNGTTYTVGNEDFNTASNWSTVAPNLGLATGTPSVPGANNVAVVQTDLNNGTILGDDYSGIPAVPITINQISQGNTLRGLIISTAIGSVDDTTLNINNTSGQPLTITGTGASTGDFLVDSKVTLNYSSGPLVVTNGLTVIGDNASLVPGNNADLTTGGSGTLNLISSTFSFDAAITATQMVVGLSFTGTANDTAVTAVGTVTQGMGSTGTFSSVVTTGSSLTLGSNGGQGTWNITDGSTLQTGTLASSYKIILGSNGGAGLTGTDGEGMLYIGGNSTTADTQTVSTFSLGRSGSNIPTDLQLGSIGTGAATGTTGGYGQIIQEGNSDVFIAGKATTVEIGDSTGGTGLYQLKTGVLSIGTNATDDVTFTIGANGSTGNLTQTGGTMIVGSSTAANATTFDIGPAGTGIGVYSLDSGVATFYSTLTIGATGVLNLNGGTLNISTADFGPTGVTGNLNFGGGTLRFTSGTTFNDTYGGGALSEDTVSTIDASMQNLGTPTANTITTVTIAQNLSGSGGITLIGTDGTNGNALTTFSLTGTNTYSGVTTIAGGELDAVPADIEHSSELNITSITNSNTGISVGTLKLTLGANGFAYNGTLAGTGNLELNFNAAGDTFTLQNASGFTGAITLGADGVNKGNLLLYNGSFGTVGEAAAGNTVTIGGALPGLITNPDAFVAPTTGTVTIASTTYTGATTINHGFTLNVTGAGGIAGAVSNAGTLNTPAIGGDLINNGTTSVTGTGIAGSVIINTGTISATFVGGASGVMSTGTFIGASALGATTVTGTVMSTGTLGSGTALPTVAGVAPPGAASPTAATFTSGGAISSTGTLVVRANGIAADSYFADGNTASTVSGTLAISGHGDNKYTIFSTPNSTITLGALTIASPAIFTGTVALNAAGNALVLTTTQIPSADFALTPTQRNVATSLDRYLIGTVPVPIGALAEFDAFNAIYSNLTAGQYPAVQEQLTPTTLQYARNIAFENSNYLAQRMEGVDANLRAGYGGLDTSAVSIVSPGFGSGLGRSLGSLLAADDPGFHSAAPNGVNYYPGESGRSSPSPSASEPEETPTYNPSNQVISDTPNPYLADVHPGAPETPKLSEFIGGDIILADLNRDGTLANAPSSKGSYTAGGATAGVSFRVTNHFAAGVLFDYNHTDADTDNNGSKIKVDSYSPGVFATYFDKGFYADGMFSFGYNNYSNSRAMPTFGTTAKSSPNGEQYVGDLAGGYDFHPDKAWVVGPTLGVTYTHLDIDSTQETGGGLGDLSIDSQNVDSLRSRLGGHVLYQTYTGDVLLQPSFSAMWQHEYLDNASSLTSNFTELGGASTFSTPTAAPSRDSALIGLGLTATLNNSLALYLNYLADVGQSDYFSQSVIGGLKARF